MVVFLHTTQRYSASILNLGKRIQTPLLPDRLLIFIPAASLKGFGRSAMAATESPGAALSNQPLVIRIQDGSSSSSSSHMVMVIDG